MSFSFPVEGNMPSNRLLSSLTSIAAAVLSLLFPRFHQRRRLS